MPMMRFLSPISCALPQDPGGTAGSRDAGLSAPMMDATYKMLAALDEMSKAARAAPPLISLDPDVAADAMARGDASAPISTRPAGMTNLHGHTRRRRDTGAQTSNASDAFLLEFRAELAQRKTEDLARIELTGYAWDNEELVLSLVEQFKRYMVDEGFDPRLIEVKVKTLALWDKKSKHGSMDILYVPAPAKDGKRDAAAPAPDEPEPAATPVPPVVKAGNLRRQSYAILEEVTPRATTPPSSPVPVDLSTVERRSLDIIAFDVKKAFGRDASEITLTGYARDNAQSVMPKLEKMADYLAHTKGLRRDSIRLDPRRLDPAREQAGRWDQRVEIDVRDPAHGVPRAAAAA